MSEDVLRQETTFVVNGKPVPSSELEKSVQVSIDHIANLTQDLTLVEQRIDRAFKDAKALAGEGPSADGKVKAIKDLKLEKDWHIWSLGMDVVDDEKSFESIKGSLQATANVLKEVAGAQFDADKILADVLTYQKDLAKEMKNLYALAVVNAHQCDWVARSITLRLQRASQGELNEAEIECLNGVLQDMRAKLAYYSEMQDLSEKVSQNQTGIREIRQAGAEQNKVLESQKTRVEEQGLELARQREKDKEHDAELDRQRSKDAEHDERLEDLHKRLLAIEQGGVPLWVKMVMLFQSIVIAGIVIWLCL